MKRFTIRLPDRLYQQILKDAHRSHVTVSQLVLSRLALGSKFDPLLKVAGICRGPLLSGQIDKNLYGF